MWQGSLLLDAVLHLNEEVAAEVGHLAQLLDVDAVLPIAQAAEPATMDMLWGLCMSNAIVASSQRAGCASKCMESPCAPPLESVKLFPRDVAATV